MWGSDQAVRHEGEAEGELVNGREICSSPFPQRGERRRAWEGGEEMMEAGKGQVRCRQKDYPQIETAWSGRHVSYSPDFTDFRCAVCRER